MAAGARKGLWVTITEGWPLGLAWLLFLAALCALVVVLVRRR